MKTLFLLITLTQNGAGDINASFVNTDSLQQCQQKKLMIEGVFTGSKIPVLESRCIMSDLQFSEFGHASNSSEIQNFFRLHFEDQKVYISKMPNWRSCEQQQNIIPKQDRIYCSSSVQSFR